MCNTNDLDIKAKFIRGFADKTRLQILQCMMDGEKTVSEIVEIINGNQSNISQHLNCLKGCGIILGRQEGKFVYYSLRNVQIEQLLRMFDVVFHEVQTEVASCDRNDACLSQKGDSCHDR
ncbi:MULTISPECIES: ArsR/SmtB family transcription factor [Bacillus cereus group]|uniref:ArsR/SmtB family transcription factor n=1 Tax=Bacillus cereus group TaxID=86661 RepID=UPI0005393095|nr:MULTISPECIES: metalloregulator ArsR/SmtB family transcription factor [Bacillus cereus group]MBJ7944567.1 winged helix-turn-helix transcriptional regulator [Bacillus cereus group sp. N24]OSM13278.1 transcriptional regulator [Bacillus toyonensis]UFH95689.1 metalloregulator ArsR/SmtB family transcription factor [Bacillus toyonensis]UKS58278.1 metalloregulator ArsR/SmtB family transcription factor [Bacillus toyonensis]